MMSTRAKVTIQWQHTCRCAEILADDKCLIVLMDAYTVQVCYFLADCLLL